MTAVVVVVTPGHGDGSRVGSGSGDIVTMVIMVVVTW